MLTIKFMKTKQNKTIPALSRHTLYFKHITNKVAMNIINLYSFFDRCIIIQNKQSYMRLEPV